LLSDGHAHGVVFLRLGILPEVELLQPLAEDAWLVASSRCIQINLGLAINLLVQSREIFPNAGYIEIGREERVFNRCN
jgi:hypothetical protein